MKYPVNQMDAVRRDYIKMMPYQPIKNEYPPTKFRSQNRRFQSSWFKKFTWLKYSPSKDAAFCFPWFLFEHKNPRNPAFTIDGFKYWKRVNDGNRCAFFMHIGCNTSPHNNGVEYLDNLMNIPRHIDKVINAQSSEEKQKNRLRVTATIESIRWLTLQACAFRGHDESPSSNNRGNFIEMINFIGKMNKSIEDIFLEKAPKNAKYTSPDIQKDVLNIISNQLIKRDASNKEQMSIVLRFVDTEGFLRERFFFIVHVTDTTAATLKKEISDALGRYDLHIHNMRGYGYDGASNMRGSWNGLQALFLKYCSCAYYVHCFAHRLQLALTAAAEKEVSIWLFFSKLNSICNLINASPKRHGELHSAQRIEVAHMVATGGRDTGRGCNQIGNLLQHGKTRWSFNFDSICSMIDMYSYVITVLENMGNEGASNSIRGEASGALIAMKFFDFIFILHLMHKIMRITNLLCQALQEKFLDILSAMDYVSTTKTLLRTLREEGFDLLLSHVKEVCVKYDIEIPHIEARYKSGTDRSYQQNDSMTVEHHLSIWCIYNCNRFSS
ncbi:uncharacterized protein [Primulina huaijiensis]|uniref:uncharacterized protein n=1 Tax=Primulina huaijiensis TaxID=1492673 RepID=UPI003CC7224B